MYATHNSEESSSEIQQTLRQEIDLFMSKLNNLKNIDKYKINDSDLEFHKLISSGGFSQVYSGYFKNIPVAIKKIKLLDHYDFKYDYILQELQILIDCAGNENITKLYGINVREKLSSKGKQLRLEVYMVLELLGTDLERIIFSKRRNEQDENKSTWLTRTQKIYLASQILNGLKGLHSKGYAHLDLKLTNLMISNLKDLKLKLIDFGLSKKVGETRKSFQCGVSARFLPFEYCLQGQVSMKFDVWAFGMVIYEIFSGERVFNLIEDPSRVPGLVQMMFFQNKFSFFGTLDSGEVFNEKFGDPEIENIIEQCVKSHEERISIEELIDLFSQINAKTE